MFKGVPKSEETKVKMKANNGKYIRTELQRQLQSERQKGKPGPKNDEQFRLRSKNRMLGNKIAVGNTVAKGRIWVNNGEKAKMVYPNNIPEGYKLGRKIERIL